MAYTAIDDSSKHFQVQRWTGNASSQAVTLDGNSDMQPDLYLHKQQEASNGWHLIDSSRGTNKILNQAELDVESTWTGGLTSFDSDGFTVPTGDTSTNANNTPQTSWLWKGNGGTTSTNTDGDIDTTVQVNSDAGFSIVQYSPPNNTARTIGHGLGAIPRFIIIKNRNRSGGENWHVFHYSVGTGGQILDNQSTYNNASVLGDAYPTTTVYKLGTDYRMNGAWNYVAYCWANVQGFSKFGTYTGNGDATEGPFVYLGFKPRFVILKNTETNARAWYMYDTARRPYNPNGLKLFADTNSAQSTDQSINIYSNGFRVQPDGMGSYGTSSVNHSGQIHCYAAWAENPFVTSSGAPTTAS